MTQSTTPAAGRRAEMLRVLRGSAEPLSITDIATRLDVHPNTVRFHLEILQRAGQVERLEGPHRGPGRPPQLFRTVPGMDPAGPRHYRLLAEVLADGLAAQADSADLALRAGRRWAERLAVREPQEPGADKPAADDPVDRLVVLLDSLGFAPERTPAVCEPDGKTDIKTDIKTDDKTDHGTAGDGASTIGLRSCPFLEMATTRSPVVCSVHLGLMRGALDGWGSPVTIDRLDPFVEPDLCIAHLGAGS